MITQSLVVRLNDFAFNDFKHSNVVDFQSRRSPGVAFLLLVLKYS